ncbi:hypothetical protein IID24_05220 [Patescibacteria group bacterium]|nr:hypothetical protein [Patescibacteria group bacterium]
MPIIEVEIRGYPGTEVDDRKGLPGLAAELQDVFGNTSRPVKLLFPSDRLASIVGDSAETVRPVVIICIRGIWFQRAPLRSRDEETQRRCDSISQQVATLVRNSIQGDALVQCTIEVPSYYSIWPRED